MPVRQHELATLKRMETHLTYVVDNPTIVSRKINVLLQTYFSREPLSTDMRADTLRILPTCLRLLHVCELSYWESTYYFDHSLSISHFPTHCVFSSHF